jgi:hypothetical protein
VPLDVNFEETNFASSIFKGNGKNNMKFWKASIVTLECIDVVENVVLEKW